MSGGGGGPIGRVIGQINQAEQIGNPGSPGFVPPSQLSQQSAYRPTQAAPQMSPFVQQMMMQRQMPQFNPFQQQMMGLPAALMQMRGQLNQPMMRGPMSQYGSQGNPLAYRPDMTQANQALNRVKPSVYKTELDNARARIAELERAQTALDNNIVYRTQEN
jgi:hypothetical protein